MRIYSFATHESRYSLVGRTTSALSRVGRLTSPSYSEVNEKVFSAVLEARWGRGLAVAEAAMGPWLPCFSCGFPAPYYIINVTELMMSYGAPPKAWGCIIKNGVITLYLYFLLRVLPMTPGLSQVASKGLVGKYQPFEQAPSYRFLLMESLII